MMKFIKAVWFRNMTSLYPVVVRTAPMLFPAAILMKMVF